MSDWIKLSVGGVLFETTRLTLTSCPDSLLAAMFAEDADRPPAAMEDGAYKLDADSDTFGVILNWLRRRKVLLKAGVSLESLQVEAEYFGLTELTVEVDGIIEGKKKEDRYEKAKKDQKDQEEKKYRDKKDLLEEECRETILWWLRRK